MIEALKLRCQIANDEALVEHLGSLLADNEGAGDTLPAPDRYPDERAAILDRLATVLRRMRARRARLAAIIPPSAPLPRASASRAVNPTIGDNSAAAEETAAAR